MKLKLFYTWLLPAVWLPVTIVSFYYSGDEHVFFAFATFPFIFLISYIFHFNSLSSYFLAVLPLAVISLALLGLGMDRLKINRFILLIFPVFFIILIWFVLSQYPSLEELKHKHRSLLAPISAIADVSLYIIIVFSFFAAFLSRVIKFHINKNYVGINSRQQA